MKIKIRAFTLAELLITLSIIGIVSVIVMPTLMHNVQGKTLSVQIKNFISSIQQLAGDQMISNRTNVLAVTDFSDAAELMSSKNFSISQSYSSATDAWNAGYNCLNGSAVSMYDSSKAGASGSQSRLLKNGIIVTYVVDTSKVVSATGERIQGHFFVDVNGTDSPNIIGRDVFSFYVTNKGRIVSSSELSGQVSSTSELKSACKSGNEAACYSILSRNNWEMDY